MSNAQTDPTYPLADLTGAKLAALLREFRSRTLALIDGLDTEQLIGPRLAIVNPPLWEIGHVAWFGEFWLLRHLRGHPSLLENGDQLYNSTDVAHDTRWELLLPSLTKTVDYMNEVLERSLESIEAKQNLSADEFYFYLLALFHEAMHAEALACMRQTLGYPAPIIPGWDGPRVAGATAELCSGDVQIPGGEFAIGASADFPFLFDNEKWAHKVTIQPFRIARTTVRNQDFLMFVEAGGYRQRRFWSDDGWHWLESGGAPQLQESFAKFFKKDINHPPELAEFTGRIEQPLCWRHDSGDWQERVYDRYVPLNGQGPVAHVSWHEAQAYCHWAGRRLPSEAEWEIAASAAPAPWGSGQPTRRRYFPWGNDHPTAAQANLDWQRGGPIDVSACGGGDSAFGCRQMIGNVWEWTADDFKAYPGFSPDPYKEYSEPWFGTHKVLRGGCWATSSLLIRNSVRNFYTPDRRDVWAGFRTCSR